MSTPSAFEQSLLELINQARLDPAGEFDRLILDAATHTAVDPDISAAIQARGAVGPDGARLGVDLDLLEQQFASLEPAAPLAWNGDLAEAAEVQTDYQIATDQQSHSGPAGERSSDRALEAGYEWQDGSGVGGVSENVYGYGRSDIHVHAGFFIDWSRSTDSGIQEPAGHRDAIMRGDRTEIGIAAEQDSDPDTALGPIVVTEVIGHRSTAVPQLLGVVISDADGDDFYDIGEGLGGVTVTASGEAGTITTTSWEAGGYQMALAPGSYDVTFSGGELGDAVLTGSIEMGEENLKLDALTGSDDAYEAHLVASGMAPDPAAEMVASSAAGAPEVATGDLMPGTEGEDTLTGTEGNDTIAALSGDDSASGLGGDDILSGSEGADTIAGGDGDDDIGGGFGDDSLSGDDGSDTIGAGSGDDAVSGGNGDDVVNGGAGNDVILGGAGNDTSGAGYGDDTVSGEDGDDDLGGGSGQDDLFGGDGNDSIGGGLGDDSVSGGAGDDFLAGGGRDDTVTGGTGDDTLNGGEGDDALTGGDGADVFVWTDFTAGETDRVLDFEDGIDVLYLSGVENTPGTGLAGRLDALGATDIPGGVALTYDGHTIEISGLGVEAFDLSDVIFV